MKNQTDIRVSGLRIFSFGVIAFERFSVCFWRAISWCLAFLALWLFALPAAFGTIVSVITLIVFILGLSYFFYNDVFAFRLPSLAEVDRRIERDSGVKNRPLTGVYDHLANDDAGATRDMWLRSREVLRRLLPDLGGAKLRGELSERDPYAIRLFAFMAFLIAVMAAGPEWSVRLRDGVMPISIGPENVTKADRFNIVITPPEYTALRQMILNDHTIDGETINIPQGSSVHALVNGGFGTPRIVMGDEEHSFDSAFEGVIGRSDGELIIKQGFLTLGGWPYTIVTDQVPSLSLVADAPSVLPDGTFSVGVSVKDDYGVQYLEMDIALDPLVEEPPPIGSAQMVQRSVISPDGEDFELAPIYDLSAHPWAGLPVTMTFKAIDELGQASKPQVMKAQLPERAFQHPVAKTLAALRKGLIWNPTDQATYDKIAYDAFVLSTAKEMIHNDIVVYLALKSMALRLSYNTPSMDITRSVMDLMWDTALRVEDGDLSLAARRLRYAQAALEKALQDPNMSQDDIAQLMQEFREAMGEYLQEMAREMQKRMADGQQFPQMPDAMNSMNQDALADFLDQMEQAMRDGDTKSAQEMLSQMQRLMDMMNPSMSAQMPQDMKMMQQGISDLQKLIEKQEALLVQTEKQADLMDMLNGLGLNDQRNRIPDAQNDAPQNAPPFVNTQDNQVEQEALRFVLGKLMLEANEKIGEIPESMGLAEQEMRGSSEELGYNNPLDAMPYQMRALDYLKDSQEQMAKQLQKRMVQMTGFMLSFGNQGMKRDPLGRPMMPDDANGDLPGGERVKIPDEAERRRVQEILELLRRRAGDGSRPREEREYYRRLLKRF
ncbi:MAG: DUF4175 domain-containing protein [Alphaproteobacteria bacterium]|nr:DUF4175 domain-containing protein [Alphaproteobacteria bacterium]